MNRLPKGFTAIEVAVVVAILAVLAVLVVPSIMNSLESRGLETTGKEILMDLQKTKVQAVKSKLNHRLRFVNTEDGWAYFIEKEDLPTQWSVIHGFVRKPIPADYVLTVNLPSQEVVFNPRGLVDNYSGSLNTIRLQSQRLTNYDQPSVFTMIIFAGGTVNYARTQGE